MRVIVSVAIIISAGATSGTGRSTKVLPSVDSSLNLTSIGHTIGAVTSTTAL